MPVDMERTVSRYSPAACIGCEKISMIGNPDEKHVSTSYVERANLSMRMSMRRFTGLTNAFSAPAIKARGRFASVERR